MIYRGNRIFRLKFLNPHLGHWLYPAPSPNSLSVLQSLSDDIRTALLEIVAFRAKTAMSKGLDIRANALRILNQPLIPLQLPVDWHHASLADPLWSFRLHSWDWAWPALLEKEKKSWFLTLWKDWIDHVGFDIKAAWEPEPLSRRLVLWVAALRLWHLSSSFLSVVLQQARYLEHHLERDLDNNHLVANAKALIWAGLLLQNVSEDATKWRKIGFSVLWQALENQVRADGGHVENSPSYHMAVWLDGLESVFLAQACGEFIPESVLDKLARMGDFAHALRRPDGRLPLLNDSIEDEPVSLDAAFEFESLVYKYLPGTTCLLQVDRPEPPKSRAFPESGYVVLRSGSGESDTYLLFDAGNLGPEHSPGHGHADALSFELWGRGQPLIVDPGVYQYAAGEWRNYFRGTEAHSTAVVDGFDQSVFVGAFRVAVMAHARLRSARLEPNRQEVVGEHDGYARLSRPVIHRRSIQMLYSNTLGITDEFLGTGHHKVALYFHLAPSKVSLNGTEAIVDYSSGVQLELQILGADRGVLRVEKGWISPTWYQKYPSPVLIYDFQSELPTKTLTNIRIL